MAEAAEGEFSVQASQLPDGLNFLSLAGELDLESSPRLASTLAGLEDSAVIVDLSGLTFIDSSGLHVLASAANASRAAGGALICAAPSAQVRRVIDIVQLGETVAIEDSVDVALAHIERVRQTPE